MYRIAWRIYRLERRMNKVVPRADVCPECAEITPGSGRRVLGRVIVLDIGGGYVDCHCKGCGREFRGVLVTTPCGGSEVTECEPLAHRICSGEYDAEAAARRRSRADRPTTPGGDPAAPRGPDDPA